MRDAEEGKESVSGYLDELHREEVGVEVSELRIKLHLVESQALRRLRKEVWRMKSATDIEHVSEALKTSLEMLEIPYAYCSINVLESSLTPPMVNYYTAVNKGEWTIERKLQEGVLVEKFWKVGEPSYRPNLDVEDIYHERQNLSEVFNMPIRSVLDIPFSHGTLAVNSTEINAFALHQIEILKEVAQVLSEGFLRMDDLRTLEERNHALEAEVEERKQAEKQLIAHQLQLRSLTSALVLAEEKERRRIATELHDGIGQALAFIQIKMGGLRAAIADTPFGQDLEEIYQLIDQTAQQSQSLTFELSPPVLYELGFEAAVNWLARQIRKQHDIRTVVEDDGSTKELDEDVCITLFRALRELMINVVKHAQARFVKISIWREEDEVLVVVEDDGIGFNPTQLGAYKYSTSGYGLFNLQERITHLGGNLQIKSAPGSGTRALLRSPLRRDREEVEA